MNRKDSLDHLDFLSREDYSVGVTKQLDSKYNAYME